MAPPMPITAPEKQREATQMTIRNSSACKNDGSASVMGFPKPGLQSKRVVMFIGEVRVRLGHEHIACNGLCNVRCRITKTPFLPR